MTSARKLPAASRKMREATLNDTINTNYRVAMKAHDNLSQRDTAAKLFAGSEIAKQSFDPRRRHNVLISSHIGCKSGSDNAMRLMSSAPPVSIALPSHWRASARSPS